MLASYFQNSIQTVASWLKVLLTVVSLVVTGPVCHTKMSVNEFDWTNPTKDHLQ